MELQFARDNAMLKAGTLELSRACRMRLGPCLRESLLTLNVPSVSLDLSLSRVDYTFWSLYWP